MEPRTSIRPVRIQDVALRAGVSIATVSNVVNSTRYVSQEARGKVRAAIADLGYHPSALARSLRRQETLTIALIIPDITDFFTSVLHGIEDVARQRGYSVIVANSNEDPAQQERHLEIMAARRVDGVILAFTGLTSDALRTMQERQVPVVFLDRQPPTALGPVVGLDNVAAARAAVAHLLTACGSGQRRIGAITGLQHLSTSHDREQGYREALAEQHIPLDPGLMSNGGSSVDGGRQAMHALLRLPLADRPTAVFATNNRMTVGARLALLEAGVRCPDDMGLFGFDDHEWSVIAEPPLSVIRQPSLAMGREAAEMLFRRLQHQQLPDSALAVPHEIVVRASCSRACANRYVPLLADSPMETTA